MAGIQYSSQQLTNQFKATSPTWTEAAWGMVTTPEGFDTVVHFCGLVALGLESKIADAFKGVSEMFESAENILAGPGAIKKLFSAGQNVVQITRKKERLNNSLELGSNLADCAKKVSKFFKALTVAGVVQVSAANEHLVKYTGKSFGVLANVFNLSLAIRNINHEHTTVAEDLKNVKIWDNIAKIAVAVTSATFAVFTILAGVFSVSATWLSIGIPVSLTLMISALTVSGLVSVHAKRVGVEKEAQKVNAKNDSPAVLRARAAAIEAEIAADAAKVAADAAKVAADAAKVEADATTDEPAKGQAAEAAAARAAEAATAATAAAAEAAAVRLEYLAAEAAAKV